MSTPSLPTPEPATATPGATPSPLFTAVVDPIDTAAVLALLAIVPGAGGAGPRAFERKGGGWVESPEYMQDIRGLTPPALVELDRETLITVVQQMDEYDQQQAGVATPASGGETA